MSNLEVLANYSTVIHCFHQFCHPPKLQASVVSALCQILRAQGSLKVVIHPALVTLKTMEYSNIHSVSRVSVSSFQIATL
jgi:hypothetical protein